MKALNILVAAVKFQPHGVFEATDEQKRFATVFSCIATRPNTNQDQLYLASKILQVYILVKWHIFNFLVYEYSPLNTSHNPN